MGMVKHSQNSQNSHFTMSLLYLNKEDRDEVNFLHAGNFFSTRQFQHFRYQSLLQGHAIILDGYDQGCSKYSK